MNWRESRALAGLVMGIFVVVQLAIPISRLDADRSQRFGWQMFSLAQPAPTFSVTTAQGMTEVEIEDYLAVSRVDVDVVRWLPPHLCKVVVGAVEVSWDGESVTC